MRIGLFGDRVIKDPEDVTEVFKRFLKGLDVHGHTSHNSTWLHGGAGGAPKVIVEYLTSIKADVILFKPWHFINKRMKFSPSLFYIRNRQVIENSDMVVVFTDDEPDSEVSGVYKLSEEYNIPVVTIPISVNKE